MNMISTGAFRTEMDASDKQQSTTGKLVGAWEKECESSTGGWCIFVGAVVSSLWIF